MLSDAEVICAFMEPKPPANTAEVWHGADWWFWFDRGWRPNTLMLEDCHEVEARLTHEQASLYIQELYRVTLPPDGVGRQDWRLVHASAEQKIRALATVLRPIVENANASL